MIHPRIERGPAISRRTREPYSSILPEDSNVKVLARTLNALHLDRVILKIVGHGLRHWPSKRSLSALGWHLGHHIHPGRAVFSTRVKTGGVLFVNVREFAHRHTFLYGDYESELSALIARLARPGWVFFDVGANVGFFSVTACDLGGPNSRAVAFEPNPKLMPLLIKATPICGTITVVPAAVSDERGTSMMTIVTDERNSGLSSLRQSGIGMRQRVNVITLDDYVRSSGTVPNVMKLDIEGTELAALVGGSDVLLQPDLRAVICEVAPERPVADLTAFMQQFDFRPFRIFPRGELSPFTGTPVFENLCFMRMRR